MRLRYLEKLNTELFFSCNNLHKLLSIPFKTLKTSVGIIMISCHGPQSPPVSFF